jgi:cell division protein FtsA
MLPGEEIIHVLPQEFKIDGEPGIKEPIGMYGSRLEAVFHVVVGQAALIKNAGRCIKDAGLELSGITLEPLASAEAVLSQEEKEAGVALIDIGGGTTDLAIFKDGIIRHTAVVPFGGNVITEDIKEGCSIIERQAEILKVKFGSAWPGENKDNEIVSIPGLRGKEPKEISLKNLSKIIHARVEEIIQLVFSEIKSYGYENPQKKLIAGIVLTGGGSELKHIKQLVEYITGIDTRIGYPNEHLAGDSSLEISSPLYATAVGLVMESQRHNIKGAVSLTDIELENRIPEMEVPVFNNAEPVMQPQAVAQDPIEPVSTGKATVSEEPKEAEFKSPTAEKFESNFFGTFFRKIKDFIEKQE